MSKSRHKFYAAVTLGERGADCYPAEAREELKLTPGEKLLVFQGPRGWAFRLCRRARLAFLSAEAMERLTQLNTEALSREDEAENGDSSTTLQLEEEEADGASKKSSPGH